MQNYNVGDKVMVFMDYDTRWRTHKEAGIIAITSITKIDENKGWVFTPLGKFKSKRNWNTERLDFVSNQSLVHLSINSENCIVNNNDYELYNAYGYSGFSADYIYPYDETLVNKIKERANEKSIRLNERDARNSRISSYVENFTKAKEELDTRYERELNSLIVFTICKNCKNKTTCDRYYNENYSYPCKEFDVE